MSSPVTLEKLKTLVPKHLKTLVSQSMVDTINNLTAEDGEDFTREYREKFVTHINVMKNPDFKMADYMNAVKYVSFKLMEYSNIDAYMLTFPDRYNRLLRQYQHLGTIEEIRDGKISSFVSMYNKNKLVNTIFEQTMIAGHVYNAPYWQQALGVQINLMMNAVSETVRQKAADSVLIATRPPEESKIQLEMGLNAEARESQQQMMQSVSLIAANQKKLLEAGMPLKDIQRVIVQHKTPDAIEAEIE